MVVASATGKLVTMGMVARSVRGMPVEGGLVEHSAMVAGN